MPLLKASRPALQQVTASSQARPFSLSIPARLATEFRPPTPRGYLAEKGSFPFQERATSYEEVISRSTAASSASEAAMLRRQAADQKRKIDVLQGTM
ncbi:hypothetical protein ASPVEDRAFT_46851 [Aspergillus versicolor CBS 583.65]|uniref:Uncharacterized protein n=1 Tax=Aspergillus versicolor CBS 583.65 TaxID=1036611 RepID=A0A1L9Q1E7_ASPVE|nr:uncharacterized protein ASPVEDRAFT_46851 [Aspergillus versicolor CBS 583.65]OJJ07558.1 hypothetical protein ASPVEDRAFT_46851 [Aspergillus versicolor CBS 583.65]